jgi:glutaredoxin
MKSLKLLLVAVIASLFIIPFGVFAQEEEVATEQAAPEKVIIYLFRGEGCPHCEEFLSWIDTIKDEYGEYYEIKDYEVWNNQENGELMNKVAEARNENDEQLGVPYIIIGNMSWKGFAESMETEILEQIKSEYAKDASERYDIMQLIDTGKTAGETKEVKGSDVIAIIVIILVVCGAVFGLVKARKSTN